MDILNRVEKAWKNGQEDITLTLDEFNDFILYRYETLEIITSRKVLFTGKFATYKDTLNIWVVKNGQ